jgi:nitroreductase
MDTIEAIKQRRSVRRFSYHPIPKDVLIQLVDCGRWAPSGRNEQPIEYVVVDDPRVIREVAAMTDNGTFMDEAGALVVVLARESKYFLEDGAAASQNILVAATACGLGSCWVAGDKKYYAEQVCARLGAPTDLRLVSILALGTPTEPAAPRSRRPLGEILHWNRYREK